MSWDQTEELTYVCVSKCHLQAYTRLVLKVLRLFVERVGSRHVYLRRILVICDILREDTIDIYNRIQGTRGGRAGFLLRKYYNMG